MSVYSTAEITDVDLERLAKITLDYFAREKEPCPSLIMLCQGSALHYVREKVKSGEAPEVDADRIEKMVEAARKKKKEPGVKDFDVWAFFSKEDQPSWGHYHEGVLTTECYDEPRFGKDPDDRCKVGRAVDILGRIPNPRYHKGGMEEAAVDWFRNSTNETPGFLREKAAVIIWPDDRRGKIIWPLK